MRKVFVLIILFFLLSLSLNAKSNKSLTLTDFYGKWYGASNDYSDHTMIIGPKSVVHYDTCGSRDSKIIYFVKEMYMKNNELIVNISGAKIITYDGFSDKDSVELTDEHHLIKYWLNGDGEMPFPILGMCLKKISNKY